MEEIVYKPTLEQLNIDIKKGVVNYLLIGLAATTVFILFNASALIILLPFGAIPFYLKYSKVKKSLNYRWIKIREDVVLQEFPGLHVDLKKFPYESCCEANLRMGEVYLKMKKQRISMNMRISLGSINLTGYPDKEKIVNKINERIKQYKT